jgi:hypothetical protein
MQCSLVQSMYWVTCVEVKDQNYPGSNQKFNSHHTRLEHFRSNNHITCLRKNRKKQLEHVAYTTSCSSFFDIGKVLPVDKSESEMPLLIGS